MIPDSSKLKEVKEKHESRLLSMPGVVGVGIGQKGGGGQSCIRIYVDRKDEDIVRRLPKRIKGFPTDVVEVGSPGLL